MARRGNWITFVSQETAQGREVTLLLDWRALAKVAAVTVIVGYFAVTGGLAWWLARDPWNRIRPADLMLPWRWSTLRVLRGEGFCAAGMQQLKTGSPAGIFQIRVGLTAAPDFVAARMELAQYFSKAGYYPGVRDTVLPQLERATVPREMLELLFEQATKADDLVTIESSAKRAAAKANVNPADRRWLQTRQLGALVALERHDEALALATAPGMEANAAVLAWRVSALSGLGRHDEAIALARTMPQEPVGREQTGWRALARALAAAGRTEELKKVLADLVAMNPAGTAARLFAMERFVQAGMPDEARAELEAYLKRFSATSSALREAAQRLADADAPDLARRCLAVGREQGQPLAAMLSPIIVAEVRRGDWRGAEELFAAMFPGGTKLVPSVELFRDWLRAVLDAARPEGNATVLRAVLGRRCYHPPTYVAAARGFAAVKQWEMSLLAAELGQTIFPNSRELGRLAKEAREKTMASAAKSAGPMAGGGARREGTVERLDEAGFRTQLAGLVARAEWEAAGRLIGDVRLARPDWLPRAAAELDWQEARVAYERDDRPRLRQLIVARLRERAEDWERVRTMARKYQAKGDLDGALLIAETAVEALPESLAADGYRAEVRAAIEKAKKR